MLPSFDYIEDINQRRVGGCKVDLGKNDDSVPSLGRIN